MLYTVYESIETGWEVHAHAETAAQVMRIVAFIRSLGGRARWTREVLAKEVLAK